VPSEKAVSPRPDLHEGDIVMLCQHLYERTMKGWDITWGTVHIEGRFVPRHGFDREDGTSGACDFTVTCKQCSTWPWTGDVLLVEEEFKDGEFHVADHIRPIKSVRAHY
jgi:hypothetical protein